MSYSLVALKVHLSGNKHYFPGDTVNGKVVVTSREDMLMHRLQLVWSGGVQVAVGEASESNVYFKETLQLGLVGAPVRQAGNTTYFAPAFQRSPPDMAFPLLQGKVYVFAFEVVVPMALPSNTPNALDAGLAPRGRVTYTLDATLQDQDPYVRSHIGVPVLERIDALDPELAATTARTAVFTVWRSLEAGMPLLPDYRTALTARLNSAGVPRGGKAHITVSLWHNEPFFRENGIQISLICTGRVRLKNTIYPIPDQVLQTISCDLHITKLQPDQYRQVVSCDMAIPQEMTPTIRSMTSDLLDLEYQIVVTATAQQEVMYEAENGEKTSCMFAKVPLVIATLPTMNDDTKKTKGKTKPKPKPMPKTKTKESKDCKIATRRQSSNFTDPRPTPSISSSKEKNSFSLFRRKPSPATSEKSLSKVFSAFRISPRLSTSGLSGEERKSRLGSSGSHRGSFISGLQERHSLGTRSNSSGSLDRQTNTPSPAEEDTKSNVPSLLLCAESFSDRLDIPQSFLITSEPEPILLTAQDGSWSGARAGMATSEPTLSHHDTRTSMITEPSFHLPARTDIPRNNLVREEIDSVSGGQSATPMPAAPVPAPSRATGGRKVKYFDIFNDTDDEDDDGEEGQTATAEALNDLAVANETPILVLKPDTRPETDACVSIHKPNLVNESDSDSSDDDLLSRLAKRERQLGRVKQSAPILLERVVK